MVINDAFTELVQLINHKVKIRCVELYADAEIIGVLKSLTTEDEPPTKVTMFVVSDHGKINHGFPFPTEVVIEGNMFRFTCGKYVYEITDLA